MNYWIDTRYRDVVEEQLRFLGWARTLEDDWHLRWEVEAPSPEVFKAMEPGQRLNHFPDMSALTNKGALHATLSAARARADGSGLASSYDFVPPTFSMPQEYENLLEAARSCPDAIWIVKPKTLSRGRGIEVVKDAARIEPKPDLVVQQYLSAPHLIEGRKYTLRVFVLVTSLDPLLVYLYGEGLAKLAARPYTSDADHLDDRFVHLTNPDVLKQDPKQSDIRRMSHGAYRRRLRSEGVDDEALWARVRRLVIATMMAGREAVLADIRARSLPTHGCFELLGLDVLVDADLKPWLLECNFSPSLGVEAAQGSKSSKAERAIKGDLVQDTVQLVFASVRRSQEQTEPPSDACWEKFTDEAVRERVAREMASRGKFEPVIPGRDAIRYLGYFPVPRHFDIVLANDQCPEGIPLCPPFGPYRTHHYFLDERIVLLSEENGRLYLLNPVASFIWLRCVDGLSPDAIARELPTAIPGGHSVSTEVRSTIAAWVHDGFLVPKPNEPRPATKPDPSRVPPVFKTPTEWHSQRTYRFMNWRFRIRFATEELEHWVHSTLLHCQSPREPEVDESLELLSSPSGYALRAEDDSILPCYRSALLAPLVHQHIRESAYRANRCLATFSGPVIASETGSLLLLRAASGDLDALRARALEGGFSLRSHTVAVVTRETVRACHSCFEPDQGELDLVAIVILSDAPENAPRRESISPAAALEELLSGDYGAIVGLDPSGVGELVSWIAALPCYLLTAETAKSRASLLEEILGPRKAPLA